MFMSCRVCGPDLHDCSMRRASPINKKLVSLALRDPRRPFGGEILRALIDESRDRCSHPFCDTPYLSLQAHHIIFHSCGGKTHHANGLMLCTKCHALLHAGSMPLRFVFAVKEHAKNQDEWGHVNALDPDELIHNVDRIRAMPLTPANKFTLLNDILVDANFFPSFTASCAVLVHTLLAKAAILNDSTPPVRRTLEWTLRAMDDRRAWSQRLARSASRYARTIGDHWSAARSLHVIAVCYNARDRFAASVSGHRRVLRYISESTFPRAERERLETFRARILREMAVCMAKDTPRSTAAAGRVQESLEVACSIGHPHDIDDARIRCCETATFLGDWRQADMSLQQLYENWTRMDPNLKAITMKLSARLAIVRGNESAAWEAIEQGRRFCESHGIQHQAYHFARLAWNLAAKLPEPRQRILT